MGIRDAAERPLEGHVVSALNGFNARHPWSHNDHFHGWIERNLPQRRGAALDVGCGRGELVARLASRFQRVVGVDQDAEMRAAATQRCAALPRATIAAQRFEDLEPEYDLVTMVAVLHHLNMADAFTAVRRLLRPGGRFLVVGLTRVVSRRDQLWDAASILTNPLIGLVKHPRANRLPAQAPPFPTSEPRHTFDEVVQVADDLLPGAVLRRRLAFRYTLAWRTPS